MRKSGLAVIAAAVGLLALTGSASASGIAVQCQVKAKLHVETFPAMRPAFRYSPERLWVQGPGKLSKCSGEEVPAAKGSFFLEAWTVAAPTCSALTEGAATVGSGNGVAVTGTWFFSNLNASLDSDIGTAPPFIDGPISVSGTIFNASSPFYLHSMTLSATEAWKRAAECGTSTFKGIRSGTLVGTLTIGTEKEFIP